MKSSTTVNTKRNSEKIGFLTPSNYKKDITAHRLEFGFNIIFKEVNECFPCILGLINLPCGTN